MNSKSDGGGMIVVYWHQLRHKNPELYARVVKQVIESRGVDPESVRYLNLEPGATYYISEALNELCAYVTTDDWVGWQLSLGNYDVLTYAKREQIERLQKPKEPEPTGIAAGILNKLQQHS